MKRYRVWFNGRRWVVTWKGKDHLFATEQDAYHWLHRQIATGEGE